MFSIARVASQSLAPAAAAARSYHATAAAASEVQRGVCKWFHNQKGFGFISRENGEGDVFVHHSNIKGQGFKSLMDGEPLEFKVEADPRTGKLTAVEVTGPEGAPVRGRPRPPMPSGRNFERRYEEFRGRSRPEDL